MAYVPVDAEAMTQVAQAIWAQGLTQVAMASVFSPVAPSLGQRAAAVAAIVQAASQSRSVPDTSLDVIMTTYQP